jgi:hypothetical protein
MIGEKKLKDVKAGIRDAFARKGVDVNEWLDEQMAKLRTKREKNAMEPLELIRDSLRPDAARKKSNKRKPRARAGSQT